MSNLATVDLENLSKKDLQGLISKSKKQIKRLQTKQTAELNSKDYDVIAVADAVRTLAKQKKVSPSEALKVIAKNMRIMITTSRKPRAEAFIKYQHTDDKTKTWKGFGKRPLWLVHELNCGHTIEEFLVASNDS